jgi:hypothetical protein
MADGSIAQSSGDLNINLATATDAVNIQNGDLTVASGVLVGSGGSAQSLTPLEDDSLYVTGKAEVDGEVRFDDQTYFYGNLNLIDNQGEIVGHVVPNGASQTLGTTSNPWDSLYLGDDSLFIGDNQDAVFSYDEAGDDALEMTNTLFAFGDVNSNNSIATASGDLYIQDALEVDGALSVAGMLTADTGIDTTAAGTALNLGGSMANTVNMDAVLTLNIGQATPTVNIDTAAAGTINLGAVNTTTIDIGNGSSTTTLYGSFSGAGSGSGLDADTIDGSEVFAAQMPVTTGTGAYDGAYFARGNEVFCNVPVGGSVSAATVTVDNLAAAGPISNVPLSAMVFANTNTVGGVCAPLNPGEIHIMVFDSMNLTGGGPLPPGETLMLHIIAVD